MDLTGREAKCSHDNPVMGHTGYRNNRAGQSPRPSSTDLAFFEYRGEGSDWAVLSCGNCGMRTEAHTLDTEHKKLLVARGRLCTDYTPRGPAEYDMFYCGCFGWD